MQKYFLFLFLFLITCSVFPQKYSSKSVKAIRKYEDALNFFNVRRLDDAITVFEAAIKEDDKFVEAWLMLADIYDIKKDYEKETEIYKKIIEINVDFFDRVYLNLAKSEYQSAKYKEASEHIDIFLSKEKLSEPLKKEAGLIRKKCYFSMDAMKNPVPFEPENLGDSINSEYYDYWPYLTADDQVLILTRNISPNKVDFSSMVYGQEDIFISVKVNGIYSKAKSIGFPINTSGNEGAACIAANGKYFFFTSNGRADGTGDCDIYISQKNGNVWGKPVNLGAPINTSKWESSPSISADGKTLYFASARQGGKGKKDLWVATLNKDGGFNPPINLGDSINTPDDDFSPYIHPDSKTLYFASKGHIGLGGLDLFMTRKDSLGVWSSPVNLGYPINTNKDELGLIVNSKGDMAMLASDRLGGNGCDIYSFDLYKKIQPVITTYVKGVVYNAANIKQKLKAKLELIDLETQKTVSEFMSEDVTGSFMICLPTDKNYAFNVSKADFMFYSENFSLKNITDPSKPFIIDIPLQPILVDNKVILKNVFYETNSFELRDESKAELERLILFLHTNSDLKIEISGHTDNIGTKPYNQKLSENRSKSVYLFLIKHGIKAERLTFKGYDFSLPVASNDTEEGRALNRRTEFKIISLK